MLRLRELIQATLLSGIVTIATLNLNVPSVFAQQGYLRPNTNIRSGPSASGKVKKTTGTACEVVEILKSKRGENGELWYQIRLFNNSKVNGWVRGDLVGGGGEKADPRPEGDFGC
ncbi:SH3 domain-containing protein [Nostoc commune]|uniref:SH3 domain-containing protein n=1 Tax=Nostoc commune TaxID=1178 RepID=UPI0018C7B497|nr:SH3 domain-containing protein [Nostoc commune]MBG1259789.1 SH3 domain-containing protein [Nostoc commune BAE]